MRVISQLGIFPLNIGLIFKLVIGVADNKQIEALIHRRKSRMKEAIYYARPRY